MKLPKEEQDILDSVERGEWQRVSNSRREALRYRSLARATLDTDRRISVRLAERDLVHFKKKAVAEGLPYETLIASVLHKYINGRLLEKTG